MKKPKPTPPTVIDPNQRYSIAEVTAILRVSHASVFKLINTDRLSVTKDGGRTFTLGSELIRFVGGDPARGPQNVSPSQTLSAPIASKSKTLDKDGAEEIGKIVARAITDILCVLGK